MVAIGVGDHGAKLTAFYCDLYSWASMVTTVFPKTFVRFGIITLKTDDDLAERE